MTLAGAERIAPAARRLTPAGAFLLHYLLLPALLGWFAFVVLDTAPGLVQDDIRISQPGTYDPYLDDFVVFYAAGEMAREGWGQPIYEVGAIHARQAELLGSEGAAIIPLPYFNPPTFLLPLAAVSLLPFGIAGAVWSLAGLGALAGSLLALARRRLVSLSRPGSLAVIFALVSSMPFHEVLFHGQFSFLLLAAWVAIWFGEMRGSGDRWTVAGLLMLAVKPQLALVPLGYLAFRRRWRPLALFAAFEAGLLAVALALFGPGLLVDNGRLLLEATSWENENGIWVHAMFGWNAFVRAVVGADYHLARSLITLALSAATVAGLVLFGRRAYREERPAELLAVLVLGSLLLSPHLFAQDLVLVAAPLLVLVHVRAARERIGWIAYGLVGWVLTFIHFDMLLTSPDVREPNLVTLWLAAGFVLAGIGMGRAIAWPSPPPAPTPGRLAQ